MTAANENTSSAAPPEAPASAREETLARPEVRGTSLPFDPLRVAAAILRKWHWILFSGLLLALIGGAAAYFTVEPQYTASAQLMRQEVAGMFRASDQGEPFKPRQLSVPTLVGYMKSPAVLQPVSAQAQPSLSVQAVLGGLTITPERNTDLITVTFKSKRSSETALRILNLYGREVVRLTREMQAQEAADVNRLLKKQLVKTDDDLRGINNELLVFSQEAGIINVDKEIDAYLHKLGELDLRFESTRLDFETLDLKINALQKELAEHNPLVERANAARDRLAEMRAQYTDANPLVEEQKERVAAMDKQLSEAENKPIPPPRQGESGLAASFYQELLSLKTQRDVLASQLEKLIAVRQAVEKKLRALPEKGLQYARLKARQQSLEAVQSLLTSRQREAQLYEENPLGYYRFFEAKPDQVETVGRTKKVALLAGAGGVLGALICLALVGLVESLDERLKTPADAQRVTRLPLLARLPNLESLDAVGQSAWAFRTWMALQTKLSASASGNIVCGVAASSAGEGCSTWLELLGHAAGQRESSVLVVTNVKPHNGTHIGLKDALENSARVRPEVGSPKWLIVPEDWRWDAPHRQQWHAALNEWQRTQRLVILVELTATDQPDTLLMAESLTQLIWLVGCGQARTAETTQRLETLRHAGCRFAGMVLNRHQKLFSWLPMNL